jgi:WD40 repeat protein
MKPPAPIWTAKQSGAARRIVFDPRGERLYVPGEKAVVALDAKTGKEQKPMAIDAVVADLALSADGSRLATTGADKTAKVFIVADGKPVIAISLPAAGERVALSPDGKRVAIGTARGGRVFDVASGQELQSFDEPAAVAALAFLADNRTLLLAGGKNANLYDVAVTNAVGMHPGGINGVAYHVNGTQVLTCGVDRTVKLSDLATGKATRTLGPLPESVSALAVSRDGQQLAAATGKAVKVFGVTDGKELQTLAHPAAVIALAFSPDRTRLATGTTDNLARVWDLATGKELQAFSHGAAIHGVAFHPGKPTIVITASADKTAAVHTITIQRTIAASAGPIRSIAAVPSGAQILTAGDDKEVKVWNLGNGNMERAFLGATGAEYAVAVSKNNALVATAGVDKIIRLYNFNDASLVGSFPTAATVRSLSFHPNNQALVSAGDDKTVTVWNVAFQPGNPPPPEFGKPSQTFAHSGNVSAAVYAIDGTMLLTGSDDKTARVWRVAADGPTKNLQHPNLVDAVAYNKDGTLLATACHDGVVRIWDVAKATPLKQINAHTQPQPSAVYSVAWSPDFKQVASGSLDRSIKVWDAASGALVKEIKGYDEKTAPKGHRDGVFTLTFTPDGKQLISGSSDRAIKVWNVADGAFVREFQNPNLPTAPMNPPAAHPGWIYHLRLTPDGTHIVSVGGAPRNRGYIAVWSAADGKLQYGAELPLGPFYHVALAPDGTAAVACGPKSRQSPLADAVLMRLPVK